MFVFAYALSFLEGTGISLFATLSYKWSMWVLCPKWILGSCDLGNISTELIPGIEATWGFPGGSEVKNLPAKSGDPVSIPGLARSPGEGSGNPL